LTGGNIDINATRENRQWYHAAFVQGRLEGHTLTLNWRPLRLRSGGDRL
jgi:hypothetical protein